ncbi:aromatic ring-hydroxylating dioxygenase subunit alpha [Methylopila henanensis]|uniref:Aromatic ring-hydroxylating dioxygenase subunit alpha n=1 Tax=Methylopila henanensis TaxID=873516 RepID=A0ABW4K7D2_9HYPH
MTESSSLSAAERNAWQVVSSLDEIAASRRVATVLFGEPITVAREDGAAVARRADGAAMPTIERYGYVWASVGAPEGDLFPLPEFAEPDRRNLHGATIGVRVSAPRAIENFLDMGHFPFVHTGILGEEPHTEVKDYDVEVSAERDEVLATGCLFYQPMAAASAKAGIEVEYVYRVPHPFCSVLYKSSPAAPGRQDVIALFLQPVGEEQVRAHMLLSLIDDVSSDADLRNFQQTIFAQDKPILENQVPKRLPLDPRAETPIRADKSAIAYRRWLSAKGVGYGVIPARG